jgi:hypothetical protein
VRIAARALSFLMKLPPSVELLSRSCGERLPALPPVVKGMCKKC